MRKISAFLAILMGLSGVLGFVGGVSLEALFTSGLFAIALVVAGIAALRGIDLIYLAAAWALYLGTNMAAYSEVIYNFSRDRSSLGRFGTVLLTGLLVMGVLGLVTAFRAHQQERQV